MPTLGIHTRSRRPRRGRFRKAGNAGFTLVELMVVVVLVSILAVLAIPAMSRARDDRLAFNYARQIQQLIQRGRARAAGTGGAHLVVADAGAGRGRVWLFEALDGVSPAAGPPVVLGPNPTSSCKGPTQWAGVPGFTSNTFARLVEAVDLNSAGVNVDADIRSTFRITAVGNPEVLGAGQATGALAICVTGNGTTYAAGAATMGAAITAMQGRTSFTGVAQVIVTRGGGVGLTRNVLLSGAGAPRIFSR